MSSPQGCHPHSFIVHSIQVSLDAEFLTVIHKYIVCNSWAPSVELALRPTLSSIRNKRTLGYLSLLFNTCHILESHGQTRSRFNIWATQCCLPQVAQLLYTGFSTSELEVTSPTISLHSFSTSKLEVTVHTGSDRHWGIKVPGTVFPHICKHSFHYSHHCYYTNGFGEVGSIKRDWSLPSYCPGLSLGSSVAELKRTLA